MARFRLISPHVRSNAIAAINDAPDGWIVSLSPPKRSTEQNAYFHAICGEIAKSGKKWAGKERSLDAWKAILVSGHSVATGAGGEVIPGIEGEFIAIRESTSRMGVSRAASLMEYTLAWCATEGIELKEPERGGFYERTRE